MEGMIRNKQIDRTTRMRRTSTEINEDENVKNETTTRTENDENYQNDKNYENLNYENYNNFENCDNYDTTMIQLRNHKRTTLIE